MSYAEEFFRENREAQLHLASAAKYLLKQAGDTRVVPPGVFLILERIVDLEQDYKVARMLHAARKSVSA